MPSLLLLPKLLIAGGSSFLGSLQLPPDVELMNHTLTGEQIPAAQVVCRDRWGTPMLPDGKGGYSLIAPIDKKLIAESLWIPPASGSRPVPTPPPAQSPQIIKPAAPLASATPVAATTPSTPAAPATSGASPAASPAK